MIDLLVGRQGCHLSRKIPELEKLPWTSCTKEVCPSHTFPGFSPGRNHIFENFQICNIAQGECTILLMCLPEND